MKKFKIDTSCDYFTKQHNNFMMTAIMNYPGISNYCINGNFLFVEADGMGADFLTYLWETDWIIMKEV